MATIYTVTIGLVRTHDGFEYTTDWLKLQLVDGEADFDRWSALSNRIGPGSWPEVGEWSRSPAVGQVDIFSNGFTERLASLDTSEWPWRRMSEGEVHFFRNINSTNKGRYRVVELE